LACNEKFLSSFVNLTNNPLTAFFDLKQWFPNCGTRTTSGTWRPSRWYSRPFCSSTRKKHFVYTYRVLL